MALYTLPGYALVKLTGNKYKNIAAQQKVYEAASSGLLLKLNPKNTTGPYHIAVGKIVYWEELNATAPIEYEGGLFSYVKLVDLMGYEEDENE